MKKVLFGGAFDLLHYAHIEQIKKAKSYGDYLVLNVSSDKQVRNKKGVGRPIIPQEERCALLRELRSVDKVICPDTETLDLPMILSLENPDVLVTNIGNDTYDYECKKRGIEIVKLSRLIAQSELDTTRIIKKIKKEV